MKTIVLRNKRETLHVETPLGIFNIEVGLRDTKGRRVEVVSIVAPVYPERKRSSGAETGWWNA
jgi:hypothetical protein